MSYRETQRDTESQSQLLNDRSIELFGFEGTLSPPYMHIHVQIYVHAWQKLKDFKDFPFSVLNFVEI